MPTARARSGAWPSPACRPSPETAPASASLGSTARGTSCAASSAPSRAGAAQMSTNLVLPPLLPGADAALFVLQPDRVHAMSGSNAICTATALFETGRIALPPGASATGPRRLVLETAVGMVPVTGELRTDSEGRPVCRSVRLEVSGAESPPAGRPAGGPRARPAPRGSRLRRGLLRHRPRPRPRTSGWSVRRRARLPGRGPACSVPRKQPGPASRSPAGEGRRDRLCARCGRRRRRRSLGAGQRHAAWKA